MSAVTLQEIAELVEGQLKVTLAQMRWGAKRMSEAEKERTRHACRVVVLLGWRHTEMSLASITNFLAIQLSPEALQATAAIVDTAASWSPPLAADIEAIEQQIDAKHERRMALRDRSAGLTPPRAAPAGARDARSPSAPAGKARV
jgi:hypothetical protein